MSIRTGLEVAVTEQRSLLEGQRLGLLMNQASVDRRFRYSCDVLNEEFPGQLVALFSPQHGFWGEQQANMIESDHSRYEPLGLPVFSLYSDTRRPTEESLRNIDTLVIDLQDVGTRVYTFIWTVKECLIACAQLGKRVVILDRPNPVGGTVTEGPMIQPGYESFVGGAAVPMRHGLTIGEMARLLNAESESPCRLDVITMEGWEREMEWPQTGLPWVPPSPNMPTAATAAVYPGQVLLEGTNVSEGRGTTLPFRLFGAPWIEPDAVLSRLGDAPRNCGVILQPYRFRPTFDKFRGEACSGFQIHTAEPQRVRSFRLTIEILNALCDLYPKRFEWLAPPYEYEFVRPPIDILYGSDLLRRLLAQDGPLDSCELGLACALDSTAWWSRVRPHLCYAKADTRL
ncbi:MAG: DUF1343 domain-containing protein [Planctomycetaceae bacterium]